MGTFVESDEINCSRSTISSNFGTIQSCQYNLEQLLSSGIQNSINDSNSQSEKDDKKIQISSQTSVIRHTVTLSHPKFVLFRTC